MGKKLNYRSTRSGWSNFFTLAGHFSKVFELVGLSRGILFHLESAFDYFYFVSKLWCPLKKKGLHLESALDYSYFVSKSWCPLKKKRSSLGISPRLFLFCHKVIVSSWNRSSIIPIFVPKSWCSLKKEFTWNRFQSTLDSVPLACHALI